MTYLMGNLCPLGKVILSLVNEIVSPSSEVFDLLDGTSIKPSDKTEIKSLRLGFNCASWAGFICWVTPEETPNLSDEEFK